MNKTTAALLVIAIGLASFTLVRAHREDPNPLEGYWLMSSGSGKQIDSIFKDEFKGKGRTESWPLTNWLSVTSDSSPRIITIGQR